MKECRSRGLGSKIKPAGVAERERIQGWGIGHFFLCWIRNFFNKESGHFFFTGSRIVILFGWPLIVEKEIRKLKCYYFCFTHNPYYSYYNKICHFRHIWFYLDLLLSGASHYKGSLCPKLTRKKKRV